MKVQLFQVKVIVDGKEYVAEAIDETANKFEDTRELESRRGFVYLFSLAIRCIEVVMSAVSLDHPLPVKVEKNK
jgi:hypothetical protein